MSGLNLLIVWFRPCGSQELCVAGAADNCGTEHFLKLTKHERILIPGLASHVEITALFGLTEYETKESGMYYKHSLAGTHKISYRLLRLLPIFTGHAARRLVHHRHSRVD